MIEVFEGRIGGGKTLSAVERCMVVWCEAGIVCTNIDLNWEECKVYARDVRGVLLDDLQFHRLKEDEIHKFWEFTPPGTREKPVLIIIDEADVWIGNQTTGIKPNPAFFNFLKQSRKMGNDLILITQALKNLQTQVARLTQFVWRFRDMSKWRVKAFGLAWPFDQILQVQYDYDGKTVQNRRFWKKDKRLFKCYNTDALYSVFTRLDAFAAPVVRKVERKPLVVSDWAVIGAAAVFLVVSYFLL